MTNRTSSHSIPNVVAAKRTSEPARKGMRGMDDPRRPVWLEATESFYKKLNGLPANVSYHATMRSAAASMLYSEKIRCGTPH